MSLIRDIGDTPPRLLWNKTKINSILKKSDRLTFSCVFIRAYNDFWISRHFLTIFFPIYEEPAGEESHSIYGFLLSKKKKKKI